MWSHWFCNTITGEKLLKVEPAVGSWSRVLNAAGSGSHTFTLGDRRLSREVWRDLTTPWARTLVQCWDEQPVYAGLITGRPYSRDTQTVTVQHTDVRSLFLARYPFGVSSYWSDVGETIPGRLVISGKSLRATLGLVLQAGLTGPGGGAPYGMPIVLPSLVEAGSYSTVYENFNLRKVADIMDELQKMDGGPDVDFAPRWSSSGTLEWVTRAGALTGNSFEFNLTAREAQVSSMNVAEDAQKQVTGVFGTGEGTGADRIVGGTPGASVASIPARDEVVNFPAVKSKTEASSLAREYVAAHKWPTTQPGLKVLASTVDPTTLTLGSSIRTYDRDDAFLPDGWSDYRLIGLSGGVGEELTLDVQGVRA